MTHQDDCPALDDLTALLIEHGPAAMASALSTLMNHAMQIEREQVLQAESHQRTAERQGYANGFKPKALETRVGRVDPRIPQTRGYRDENGRPFYPRSLERGVRSERAMTLAVAEMYVQGVSTRKVTAVVQELCGLDITSTQVSRAAAELDAGRFFSSAPELAGRTETPSPGALQATVRSPGTTVPPIASTVSSRPSSSSALSPSQASFSGTAAERPVGRMLRDDGRGSNADWWPVMRAD